MVIIQHNNLILDIAATFKKAIPPDWKMTSEETYVLSRLFKELKRLIPNSDSPEFYSWGRTFESIQENIHNIRPFYDSECCQRLKSNTTLPIYSFVNGYISKRILSSRRLVDVATEKPKKQCNLSIVNNSFEDIRKCTQDSKDIFSSLIDIENKLAKSFIISENDLIDSRHKVSIKVYDPIFNRNLLFNPFGLIKEAALLKRFSNAFYQILKSTYYAEDVNPNLKIKIKAIDTLISASGTSNILTIVFGKLLQEANLKKKIVLWTDDEASTFKLPVEGKNLLVVDTVFETGEHIKKIQSNIEDNLGKQFIGTICIFYNDLIHPNKRDEKDERFINEMIANGKVVYLFNISSFFISFLANEAKVKVKNVLKKYKEHFSQIKSLTGVGMGFKSLKDILPPDSPLKNAFIPCLSICTINENGKKELQETMRKIELEEKVLTEVLITGRFK